MKLNKHAPIIKDYARSTITEMANINRVKIIDMTIYHRSPVNVNSQNNDILISPVKVFYLTPKRSKKMRVYRHFSKNPVFIALFSSLYHIKAIKWS
jgi:hypothetical protein